MRAFFCVVVLVGICLQTGRAAKYVDAKLRLQEVMDRRQLKAADMTSHRAKREASQLPLSELDEMTSLDKDSDLEVTRTATTVQGTKLLRMQETFKGEVVSDAVVTLETDSAEEHVLDASGAFYQHIEQDTDGTGRVDIPGALDICLVYNIDEFFMDDISHVKVEPEIFIDDEQLAYPGYFVQYLILSEGDERRPTCIVDARDGTVRMSWDALDYCQDCTATGIGGNLRTGKIRYGELQRCLDITRVGDTCYLENKYVKVINNNFTMVEKNETMAEAASYDCQEIDDEVNGAYSPLLDAFFYGTVVGRMYEDWYDMSPLEHKMVFRVHFGRNYSNALWNGIECQYGDGYSMMHPLISADIVGHEVGHGVTERFSGLFYFEQWGAMNEAFSDMAGEATQAYLGDADWVMGIDVMKNELPPLRYFENPNMDNYSIAHVDNYTENLDPHFGSGVYNRVFYVLVNDFEIPVKEVFHVFLHANQMYWHHMTTYASGACDVMKAAYDLGQDGKKVRLAFQDVGIEVCDLDEHIVSLRDGEVYTGITVSKYVTPTFRFGFPGAFADSMEVNATSPVGEVTIIVSDKSWGSEIESFEILGTGQGSVALDFPGNSSQLLTIELTTSDKSRLTDVSLVAKINCVTEFEATDEEMSMYFRILWEMYCPEEYEADEKRKEEEEKMEEEENEEGDEAEGTTEDMILSSSSPAP